MNVYQAYQILELKLCATEQEIKERYRELVLKWHPDVNSWDTTTKFQEIQEAYETVIEYVNTKKQTDTAVKPPVKTNAPKTAAAYTRNNTSTTKTTDSPSNFGGWLIIGGVALLLLLLMVPGLQLILLILILYGVTRIL